MFLWCIINQTTAKANATITNIVRKINNLRELMIEKDSDVQSFNTTVRQLVNSYYANKREQVDKETLLANLFDAYISCKDNEFVAYIKRRKQEYIDQAHTLTPEILMEYALKQYQTIVKKRHEVWDHHIKNI
jgi:septal ring factor EnvC (AmiA/AmiB activator)